MPSYAGAGDQVDRTVVLDVCCAHVNLSHSFDDSAVGAEKSWEAVDGGGRTRNHAEAGRLHRTYGEVGRGQRRSQC